MKKTRTIAGHEITLEVGTRYLATRPMLGGRGRRSPRHDMFPVSIRDNEGRLAVRLDLWYDDANEFLKEFNNGDISFDGRMW